MRNPIDKARTHVLAWTTSAAATLAGTRFFVPNFADFIIDILSVGLVALAAWLAKGSVKK